MTWREDLRRVTMADGRRLIGATFRGAPFFVDASDRAGGRRIVSHEFPLRDENYVEDLGRRTRAFRVDGYVVGDDYVRQRDALLAALEDAAGPGELVHPFHGVRRAICAGLAVRESISDGGMAIFAIDFVEAPAQGATPSDEPDVAAIVASSADAAVVASEAEFIERYSAEGLPAFALKSAEEALTSMTEALRAELAPIVRDAQELAVFDGRLHLLTTEASSLVRSPATILGTFRGAITGLAQTATSSPGQVIDALLRAYGADLGPAAPETTPRRRIERKNQLAITGALRQIVAVEAARLAPTVPYESIEAATAARDAIAADLEDEAALADDTAYPALVTLRADVVRAIPTPTTFARLLTVERRAPIPSLLLSYQLYGSVEQELDVVKRNRIRHPGFVAGSLKVLSRA